MSGFKIAECNSVIIEHFSTSSLIKVIVNSNEEAHQGTIENINTEYWFSYSEIKDLYNALKQVETNSIINI